MKRCFLLLCLWSNSLVNSSAFQFSITTSPRRKSCSHVHSSSPTLDSISIAKQKAPALSRALYCPIIFTPSLSSNNWGQFCPSLPPELLLSRKQKQIRRNSATVQWKPNDQEAPHLATEQAARELLAQIAPHHSNFDPPLLETLQSYFLEFYQFCGDHLSFDQNVQYKARLVASRGSSGTSCPLWHIDKVPVRWIQALAGPGCQVVQSEDGINWDAFEESTDKEMGMATPEENQLRIDSTEADIYSASTNEVALLSGGRWNEFSLEKRKPIVHRSPKLIPIWQDRLLLTQDVVINSEH